MACDNCQGTQGWYCPICAPTPPAKPAVCDLCHDPTCPCGKVVLRTDAELIDALRACRWILSERALAAEKQLATLQQTVDAIVRERDALRGKVARVWATAESHLKWKTSSATLADQLIGLRDDRPSVAHDDTKETP